MYDYFDWFHREYKLNMKPSVAMKWGIITALPHDRKHKLHIYVLAEHAAADLASDRHGIHVHRHGLSAFSPHYNIGDVTGLSFIVQGVLLTQEVMPDILREAIEQIEQHDLKTFTFVCAHGTHRSVGAAVLLCTMFSHEACIHLSTHRTFQAAVNMGFLMDHGT